MARKMRLLQKILIKANKNSGIYIEKYGKKT